MRKPADLVKKWNHVLKDAEHIFTWTEPAVLAYLAEAASQSECAVEIGTYMGRSAKVILDASRVHLWCVDPWPSEHDGLKWVTEHHLADHIASGRCEIIDKYPDEAARMLEHMRGRLDLVWIDGGHALEHVRRDIRCFLPLMRPGGLMCGHDFEPSGPNSIGRPENRPNEVAQAVIELLPGWEQPMFHLWAYRVPV